MAQNVEIKDRSSNKTSSVIASTSDATKHGIVVVNPDGSDLMAAGGGTSIVDDAVFTAETTSITPIGGFANDTGPDSVNEGDAGAFRMSLRRELYTQIRDAAGNERGANVDTSNNLNVILAANGGVDVGDVTINNAAGASAVNIQDGGNSITVDGTVSISGAVDTELPTAAALADTTANPTVPAVGSFPHHFNGTTWDRMRGTTANGLDVDVTRLATAPANDGVDIGDVTINNASGGSAVNIQDGGNSITVDGSVSVTGEVNTELPAAAGLADGAANPTTPTVGADLQFFNGTTWDRARGDTTNGLDVDVTRLPATPAGSNAIGTTEHQADKVFIGGALRTLNRATFDVDAATTTIVAAVALQNIYVVGIEFTVNLDDTTFKLVENSVGDLHDAQTYQKGSGKVNNPPARVLWVTSAVNTALDITTTVGKATGTLWYAQF